MKYTKINEEETEFYRESEKNNRFSPSELSFWAKTVFKKNGS
jgi:uncharacterized protein YfkK (UPF0435 family)